MNGLDVNIIQPKGREIHEGDPIHFFVHILKENDKDNDFQKVQEIVLRIQGLNNGYQKDTDPTPPVISDENEKQFFWLIDNNELAAGPYIAKAIITKLDEPQLANRIKSKQFSIDQRKEPIAERDPEIRLREPVRLAEDTEIGIRGPIFKGPVSVSLQETRRIESSDQLLWILIRNRTIKFDAYINFINSVMSNENDPGLNKQQKYLYANRLPFNNVASYSLLKYATEKYLMQECGLVPSLLLEDIKDKEGINYRKWEQYVGWINGDKVRTARALIDNKEDINRLKGEFLHELFVNDNLPYLNRIKDRLEDIELKKPFEVAINFVEVEKNPENPGLLFSKDAINIDAAYGILPNKLLSPPMMELIWSYWHEEGGLVQTMNAISRRFQNMRNGFGKDPLSNFNLDPLRPLNNLLWGYIEDERNRLSMSRRNLEYQYEYGLSLIGKAVPQVGVAEHRTNFIRAFHNLLKVALDFYNQANFTTVIPDAFPLLNHLREVHLILAEGAHNQYGDLPWTSRAEMLIQQWLLSRTEMREFLGGRIMVPYNEPWMDKVDSMKTLQDWNVPNITHFHDLAVFGEQLLLSIRYGNWNSTTNIGVENAANWAHYWRNEVQRYVHAYNAVTGVDLSADITDARVQINTVEDRYTPPAILIQKQATLQKSRQQYALQNNGVQPSLLQNGQATAMPTQPIPQSIQQPIIQKKLNG